MYKYFTLMVTIAAVIANLMAVIPFQSMGIIGIINMKNIIGQEYMPEKS